MQFDTTGALAAGYTQAEVDAFIKANTPVTPKGPQAIDVAEEKITPIEETVKEPVTNSVKPSKNNGDIVKNITRGAQVIQAIGQDSAYAKKIMDAGKVLLNNLAKYSGKIPPKLYKEVAGLKAAGKVNLALQALITGIDVYDTVGEWNKGELKDTGSALGNAGIRALRQTDKTLFDVLPDKRTKDKNFDENKYNEKQLIIKGMGGAKFMETASAERLKLNSEAAAKFVNEKRKSDPSYTIATFYKQYTYNPTLNKFIPNK